MKKLISILFLLSFVFWLNAQEKSVDKLDKKYYHWHLKDPKKDKIMGISLEKAKNEIIKNNKPVKTVVVAVIDGGVDINHEDLQGKFWVNPGEIPNNGIDDDNNGYIDDIYGWNFIGNSKGENLVYENMEYTRIIKKNMKNEPYYADAKSQYDKELQKRKEEKANLEKFERNYYEAKEIILANSGVMVSNLDDLKKVKPTNSRTQWAYNFLKARYEMGFTEQALEELKYQNNKYLKYYLNLDYNPRVIVGDNPTDIDDRNYGNNDVKGPRSNHGTSVTGVIAALQGNGIGIDGIAVDVKIMVLRIVPEGDERDKDVALAIKYAVDNKADIINMSFGKDYSPEKQFVDWAVKYAAQHNVLLIHSAGNSSKNVDKENSYPSDRYADGSEIPNILIVGASDMKADKNLPAIFTNYGSQHVDIFSPGVNIITLDSNNTYDLSSGTSIAGPVVTGAAALILSYYPQIKPEEMIDLLMQSAYVPKKPKKVYLPNPERVKKATVPFSSLSKSKGIVNVYQAFLLAQSKYGKLQ